MVNLERFTGNCGTPNDLSDGLCVSKKIKYVNVKNF